LTEEMPRKLPPFVYREKTRHGRAVYYFRREKGLRTRLPDYGSDGFDTAYRAALEGTETPKRRKAGAGSLAWLIARYRETGAYRQVLSPATRRQRDNILKGVVDISGGKPFKAVTKADVMNGREKRSATPAQARNFLDALRGLFAWAVASDLLPTDPTEGVKNPPRPKTGGFKAWTMEDVGRFEARWPAGSKERVWLHVLLYTGLRRGDAVLLGRQHVKNGVATLRTEKTNTEVYITIYPPLERTLAIGPVGDLAFIVGADGKPITKETFGNYFREACDAAGIRGKSAHGLRKLAATVAAELGATVSELEAMFGWTGGTMASLYTKSAERKRLAWSGGEKVMNSYRPHPAGNSPHPEKDKGGSKG